MWNLLNITFGTASLAAFIHLIYGLLAHRNGRQRIVGLAVLVLFLVLTFGTWWLGPKSSAPEAGVQSDTVTVSGRDDELLEIFYPQAYVSPPSLKLSFASGSGNLRILEQRSDGFKFKMGSYSYSSEAVIEWKAIGTPKIRQ